MRLLLYSASSLTRLAPNKSRVQRFAVAVTKRYARRVCGCLTGLSAAGAAAMYGLPTGGAAGPGGGGPYGPHPAAAAAAAAAAAHQLANSFYAASAAPHPSAAPPPHDLAHHMSWSVNSSTR